LGNLSLKPSCIVTATESWLYTKTYLTHLIWRLQCREQLDFILPVALERRRMKFTQKLLCSSCSIYRCYTGIDIVLYCRL